VHRFLGRFEPFVYCAARIVIALLYTMHGSQKLFAWPIGAGGRPGATVALASLQGAAGIIEFAGGLMVTLGFQASWAAFICSGEMAFAYFLRQFPYAVWPITPRPGILAESAVINCFFFLYVAARGSGPISIDRWLGWNSEIRTGQGDRPLG
jgi:putative oxidoreductase